jgi:endonuclease/exonuclease/phosphatase family metal-dependent hydrolase
MGKVIAEMRRYKIEILRISETRWTGFGEITIQREGTFIYSRTEEEHKEGVGMLLSKRDKRSLLEWEPVSSRIITSRLKSRVKPISIIQCYAPTEASAEEIKDEFYGLLKITMAKIKKRDIFTLMGDMNAKVGKDNKGIEQITGKHTLGESNDNRDCFIELCGNYNLVIGGSVFPHRECHKVTWVSCDKDTENQIDHLSISRQWRSSLYDVRKRKGADAGSDHHLVIGEIKLKIAAINKLNQSSRSRFDTRKLNNPKTVESFRLEV